MIGNTNGEGIKVISSYIARWALPNEGIPIFLIWEELEDFDFIRIQKPDDFVIRDYYNVEKVRGEPNLVFKEELKSIGYIGFVLSSQIMDELSRDVRIVLEFVRSDKLIYAQTFSTRILRPKILMEVPRRIILRPNAKTQVEFKLRYTGYGNIYGKIIVSSNKRNLHFDVQKLIDLSLILANHGILKDFIRDYDQFKEAIDISDIPDDQYDYREFLMSQVRLADYTPRDFLEAFNEIVKNRKLSEMLEEKISKPSDLTTDLFASIIDFVEKRPVEDVFIADSGVKQIEVEPGQEQMYFFIGYVDDFGNYYEEVKSSPVVLGEKGLLLLDHEWEKKAGDWTWLKDQK